MRTLVFNCCPVRDGATAELVRIIAEQLSVRYETETACIADYDFRFCTGCRSCHETGVCALPADGVSAIMAAFEAADIIVMVSPSYWADVPGQCKAFIDRCTPWSNTHEPHAALSGGKKGYAAVLRTGPNMRECERLLETISHFYGHLDIPCCGTLGLTSVAVRADILPNMQKILDFCDMI